MKFDNYNEQVERLVNKVKYSRGQSRNMQFKKRNRSIAVTSGFHSRKLDSEFPGIVTNN